MLEDTSKRIRPLTNADLTALAVVRSRAEELVDEIKIIQHTAVLTETERQKLIEKLASVSNYVYLMLHDTRYSDIVPEQENKEGAEK